MMTRLFTTLLLICCLAVAHASAARAADTGAHARAIQEKDTVTSILTEPVRGRETGAAGPNTCVLPTGATRQADDGHTWMEITQPAPGWIPAENMGAPNPACEAAYQVIASLYETLYASSHRMCMQGGYTSMKQVPEIRDWVKAHAAPSIQYRLSHDGSTPEGAPLDQAMDVIMAVFEYLPAYRPDCSDVPREEFFDYFPAVLTDEPDTFHFTIRENVIDQFRTLHFRNTPDGPVIFAVVDLIPF